MTIPWNSNYLEHELHAVWDETEPSATLLRHVDSSVAGAGDARVHGDRSIGQRVEKTFGSGVKRREIDAGVEGIDRRHVVEAELDSGGDESISGAVVGERVGHAAGEGGERGAGERRGWE